MNVCRGESTKLLLCLLFFTNRNVNPSIIATPTTAAEIKMATFAPVERPLFDDFGSSSRAEVSEGAIATELDAISFREVGFDCLRKLAVTKFVNTHHSPKINVNSLLIVL